MTGEYKAPNLPREKITPLLVRDELLKCFESANKEFFAILNQPATDEAVRAQVRQFVTTVFKNCGANFENPTKQGIVTAINQCKAGAESMMGDRGAGVIRHHYDEMMKLVNNLA